MSRVLSLATVGELLECKAQPQQTASPFSCTKQGRVANAALFIFERDLNPRGSERKKQSGGLFLARSGEPGTVACDGRRAISMQGTAAVDVKSRLSHQKEESQQRLFFILSGS